MKYIDYLFWSYYSFLNRHSKVYFGDNRWQAICTICATVVVPLGVFYALLDIFVINLPALPKDRYLSLLIIGLLSLPLLLFLNHRYYYNKTIIRGNFRLFKDRWGEDPRTNKKGRMAVIIYTICTLILPWFGPVILHFICK